MAKKRKTYSNYEKQQALDLAGQVGVKAASKKLGIPESTLRGWGAKNPATSTSGTSGRRPADAPRASSAAAKPAPPIYLQWPVIGVIFLVGCIGRLFTDGAVALWVIAIVLAVIRWQNRGKYAPVKKKEPVQMYTNVPVETEPEPEEPPAPAEEHSAVKKFAADYHYDDVKLCIIRGQEPDFGALPVGTSLLFRLEPENEHDEKAVKVCLKDGSKVGYLYSGKLRDMATDFVSRGDMVLGQVTSNDGQTIKFCMDFARMDIGEDVDL